MSGPIPMTRREAELVGIVRTANNRLIEQGCSLNQLAVAHPCPNRNSTWNMWANIREGALLKLARLRDVPVGSL